LNAFFSEYKCSSFTISRWDVSTNGLSFCGGKDGAGRLDYSLTKYFGLTDFTSYGDVGPVISADIKGCVINGISYGDTTITEVNNSSPKVPLVFALMQNYPNPFNPSTNIKYSIARSGRVELSIFNILGQKVKELVNEEKLSGEYEVVFDGKEFTSGIYFYRLRTNSFTETKKLILLK
jgi:hypothetical protein